MNTAAKSGAAARVTRRPASQADVAALAGVSSQTVSRVANNRSNVEPETRERVLSAMRTLGYQRNSAARALTLGRFHALGVVTFDVTAQGNARTLAAISRAAQASGYSVNVVCVENETEDAVQRAVRQLTDQAVDGLAVIEAQILDRPGFDISSGVPIVVADGDPEQRYTSVDTDQAAGVTAAVRHLLDLGHRTVWHIGGPQNSYAARRRAAAWRTALETAGAPVPPIAFGDWTAASGYEIGRRLASQPDVTAVFAANDQLALGLLLALNEADRRVPHDVSVVGFDDIPEAAYFVPPLTTVRQNFEEVGRQCVARLLDQIDPPQGEGAPVTTVAVQPELIVRASSAAPPGATGPA
ncbi:LacI family DNA-binding transcriptional regulator [Streptomyces sp. BE20]|uniref:LacI family DNA-binding transcriptional regulator n=1 Tax=unclassified Streptomyces TaxID=2593676 RepID=UPI002E782D53|nr:MULTISPECIES: LacI family DNA-binding transcriptional regulator [unclassified Streptomyces]MED7948177.1 LacI family DNA-binding transcriptional regulator [Streptomyces sp. BE303]MEE1820867.1 LacI family DNA-binding transcriptional regulator [Streptomyces sp. BE20]